MKKTIILISEKPAMAAGGVRGGAQPFPGENSQATVKKNRKGTKGR